MDDLLKSVAAQVPGMIVLALIVKYFLNYLKDRDNLIRDINRENIEAREQSRIVIERNTETAAENTAAMHQMTEVMKDFVAKTKPSPS